jgi:galacturonosyltransferase
MKILILANNDVGLYKFRKELIIKLLKTNSVFISLPYGEFVDEFVKMGCSFVDTSIQRHGTNPIKDLALKKFYKKMIKDIKPDIVLTYTIKPNVYGGMVCSSLKIPYIANVTGLGNAIENPGLLRKISLYLYKKGLKNASVVFFQNKKNLEYMLENKVINDRYKILPGSGVNIVENKFETYPTEEKTISFLMVGRIMQDKGIFELIAAAKQLKEKYSNLKFVVVGPMDDDYQETINQAVQDGVISYLGKRNDIHDLMKNSHAIIHPSYHEGMSNVLLEAASCGRPVLATNVPGCIETFDDGVSGISFKPKDVGSLIDAVEKFLNMSLEQKESMGVAGRKKVEKEFDREIVISDYISEINKITKEKTNETL